MHYRTSRYLRRSALAVAMGLVISGTALAQSNASGVIFGQVQAQPGTTVHLENLNTGLVRDITVDSGGRYRASSLPVGHYRVTLQRDGSAVSTRDNVAVQVGSGTEVSFVGQAASTQSAQTLEGVQVVASALPAIDISATDSRTVLTADQLQKIPVARDITATSLLAPGTVAGDSRYGNVASFGGSAASENAYYINGFPVTNPLTSIGLTQLPFDAIDQEQVLTGGYGAEFGRSTGGVINIITKRGGNTWKAGIAAYWTPKALMASPRNIVVPNNGTELDGTLNRYRNENTYWETSYGAYLSGPLIKDKLFMYFAGEFVERDAVNVLPVGGDGYRTESLKTPRWLAKVDWNITDNHILELTAFSDKTNEERVGYSFDYDTLTRGTVANSRTSIKNDPGVGVIGGNGADTWIAKYTGYLTDDLTITGLYGKQTSDHSNIIAGSDPNCPSVIDNRTLPPNQLIHGCQTVNAAIPLPFSQDKTRSWRLDVEYRLGDHDIRAGVDNQNMTSLTGGEIAGGFLWRYDRADNPSEPVNPALGVNGAPGGNGDYVSRRFQTQFANVSVKQQAQYVEDRWQINDRWLASIGLRNEQFTNFNSEGVSYASQRHQLAPRLGVTWDVNGDSTFKVFANAGRYHLAMPNNVAVRGASGSLITQEYFTYTGVDPVTGAPTGLTPLGPGPVSANNEFGQAPDPRSVAAHDLRSHYQDEYILGMEKELAPNWNMGAKLTYRKLKSAIDDFCDPRPFQKYADRNGIDISNANLPGCFLFNPGKSNTFLIDVDGQGNFTPFKLTKEDFISPDGVGYPDLKRQYYALDLFLEHPFDGRWFGRIDYTFSRSYGDAEGQLLSDLGQVDVSQVQTWDFPELMVGANGPLPNDRTHQIKAFGYYQVTPEWLVGGNMVIASGRPKNCLGINPDRANIAAGYGSSFFFCDFSGNGNFRFTPRGSQGRLPWTYRLDLSATWRPAFADHDLAFRADVFNVFNRQGVQNINERFNSANTTTHNPAYGQAISYAQPRFFRFSVNYDFSL